MNIQVYKERMLEMESLTNELEDAEANWLLDWGKDQLDRVLSGVDDSEAADQKATAMYAVIRKINHIMGRVQRPIEDLANEFFTLAEMAGDAYCRRPHLTPVEAQSAATHFISLEPANGIKFLTHWVLIACQIEE